MMAICLYKTHQEMTYLHQQNDGYLGHKLKTMTYFNQHYDGYLQLG